MKIQAYSIKGRKQKQEDDYLMLQKNSDFLVLVADGVGGHGNGDFASSKTISVFKQAFDNQIIKDPFLFLEQNAKKAAHAVINKGVEDATFKNCGTTLTGFLFFNHKIYIINIGDSRTYHYYNKQLFALTKDQSIIQQMIDRGEISEQKARSHPKRKIMTSAIGQKPDMIKIDLNGPFEPAPGGKLLVCSDGVHDFLFDSEIEAFLLNNSGDFIAKELVELAYQKNSDDNITACIFEY